MSLEQLVDWIEWSIHRRLQEHAAELQIPIFGPEGQAAPPAPEDDWLSWYPVSMTEMLSTKASRSVRYLARVRVNSVDMLTRADRALNPEPRRRAALLGGQIQSKIHESPVVIFRNQDENDELTSCDPRLGALKFTLRPSRRDTPRMIRIAEWDMELPIQVAT